VLFSDFDTASSLGDGGLMFPDECSLDSQMSDQEKEAEFMFFDLNQLHRARGLGAHHGRQPIE
jgi:hypothetical protein